MANKKIQEDESKIQEENYLTTNHGVRINHTDDSLKAGERGPTIIEDFHFREKMMAFDHERIPERVVHARGSAAHGYFEVYESLSDITKAGFLQNPAERTPVFVRFSTVVGFRGSADTVRDARGFATKFYTREGNYDLVGNNIPVFFIQDAIKFPDLVHAIKPEPHHEMPQASAAHDNFWDFISLVPETMHMVFWVLSDRGIPRSYSMMEGFGVHTFRLVNAQGISRFVKFHWKPKQGVHSLVWDEAQKIAGKDPDFNRRDLWESIEAGNYPEYELGIQIIEESDEHAFDFDILDATKLWPEELIPVRKVGKMVLNKNVDNFFAETEQVAFHPGHVVPGIDVSNDPLLQGRLFSYLDTQLTRLGGPNFQQIPVNRPHSPVNNNQHDGFMRQENGKGRVNYFPNSLGKGCPMMAPENMGGYVHYPEQVSGNKTRARSESFKDHFSQARLFYNSMSEVEKMHIQDAFLFELGKVETMAIRERMIGLIAEVDTNLAKTVAEGIGVKNIPVATKIKEAANSVKDKVKNAVSKKSVDKSPALSMDNLAVTGIKGRKVAVLLAEGYAGNEVSEFKSAMEKEGVIVELVSTRLGSIPADSGPASEVTKTFLTTSSVLYDAVYVPGGEKSLKQLLTNGKAIHFIEEAYMHCKPVAASGSGIELFKQSRITEVENLQAGLNEKNGVVTTDSGNSAGFFDAFKTALGKHRHWNREKDRIPA